MHYVWATDMPPEPNTWHSVIVNDIAVNAEGKALYSQYVLCMVWWAHSEEWKAHIAEYKMSLAAHKLHLKCSVKLAYFYESQILSDRQYTGKMWLQQI